MKQNFYFLLLTSFFGLTTSIRAQAPTVVTRLPARNTTTAPLNSDVGVTFSQPIAASTATGLSIYSAQAGGKKKGVYTASDAALTFNPTSDFKPGEKVAVTIPATVRSTLNTAAAPQVYEFTTAVGGTGRAKNFRTSSLYAGGACFGFATGDVDGDGDIDIVENNQFSYGGSIFIFLNGGNNSGSNTGVFSAGTSPKDDLGQIRNLALGDVDGDGDLDLVVLASDIYIFLNGGDASGSSTGVFTRSSSVKVGRRPSNVALGDVDGDGDLDIAVGNFDDATVSVCLNGGDNSGSNTGTFKNGSDLTVGWYPAGIALADVDGDGDLDMLVSNNGTATDAATVKVCLNGGDAKGSNTGVFNIVQKVAVDGIAQYYGNIAVGDIDGDGDVDFALATYDNAKNTSTVSVRLNGGDATGSNTGVFGGSQTVAIGGVPYSVAFGDADADGDLDLAVSTLSNKAFVRLNGGDATGSHTGVFSGGNGMLTGDTPYNVGMADVDGDGDLDLLTADYGFSGNGATITIGLNQPLAPVIDNVSPTSGVAGTLVTLTGSNLTDATITVSGKAATVTANTGSSLTFKVPIGAGTTNSVVATNSGGTSTKTFTVLVAVTATSPAANTQIAFRYSSPVGVTFTEPVTYSSANRLAVYSAVAGGRKHGQAYPFGNDLQFYATFNTPITDFQPGEVVSVSVPAALVNGGGIGVSKRVYQFTTAVGGLGRGNFQPGSIVSLVSAPVIATAADVDSDGDQDLIVATAGNAGLDNSLNIRLNKGDGTFQAGAELTLPAASKEIRSIVAADLDADGDLDIVTANAQTNNLTVVLNNGRGGFIVGSTLAVGTTPNQVVAADVDGDGYLDLLTVNKGANTVSVRLNAGYGYFNGGSEVAVGAGANTVTVGDIDADGDLDLLTANSSSNTVSVRLNNGAGVFSGTGSLAVGVAPASLALADIDADGDLDLLVANTNDNSVSLLRNDGSGLFSSSSRLAVGAAPTALALADVDADGRLDILTTNSGDNTVSVLRNTGAGTFSSNSPVSTGTTPPSLVTTDIDKDGDLDLLLVNKDDNTVAVHLNQPFTPTLIAFTPASGTIGTKVTVTGTNLTGTTGLTLNGVAVIGFQVVNSTTLTFTVPTGATSGVVAITTPGGTATSASSFLVVLPTPTITSLTPSIAVAGSGAFTLMVTGTGFVSGSIINFGTIALSTTYNAATQLTAQVPASLLVAAGTVSITVANPSPEEGGTSAAATFTITAPLIPAPTLVSFTPASGLVGTSVTITGTNLTGTSTITLNGTSVSSFTVVDATTLSFLVPTNASSGLLAVTTPGGTATSSTSFTVLLPNPAPIIGNLSPAFAMAGSGAVALMVMGTGYLPSSVIHFNGIALSTSFLSATQLTATIPATALTIAGTYAVAVENPAPGGGSSPSVSFTVLTPAPMLMSFMPASGPVGTSVTVTGTNLLGTTSVTLNGAPIATYTVVDATTLTFTVPVGATSGLLTVTTPSGTATSTTAFTVIAPNPAPTLVSLSPDRVEMGSTDFTLTLTGTGFGAGSVVVFNGSILPTTYVSTTQLTAQMQASNVAVAGIYDVVVRNPAPGGGSSTALPFMVMMSAPGITNFTPTSGGTGTLVTVTGTNLLGVTQVYIGTTLIPSFTVVSATSLTLVLPVTAGIISGNLTITTPGGTTSSTTAFGGVLATTASQAVAQLLVYPNPFQHNLTVDLPGAGPVNVLLRDVTGRVVLPLTTLPANRQLELPNSLVTGVYLLEVRQGDTITTRRLLKQ